MTVASVDSRTTEEQIIRWERCKADAIARKKQAEKDLRKAERELFGWKVTHKNAVREALR